MIGLPLTLARAFPKTLEVVRVGSGPRRRFGALEHKTLKPLTLPFLANQLPTLSLDVEWPREAACSSTKDFSASGREMLIVVTSATQALARIWQGSGCGADAGAMFVGSRVDATTYGYRGDAMRRGESHRSPSRTSIWSGSRDGGVPARQP